MERTRHTSGTEKAADLPEAVRYAIDGFAAEGLLGHDYVPPKGSWKEQLASVKAQATLRYHQLHVDQGTMDASPEQVASFVAASAYAPEGSTDAIASRLLDRWMVRSQDYVHRCSRCHQQYDQTLNHQGRQFCRWCLHRITGQRIPYLNPIVPDPEWEEIDALPRAAQGDAYEGPDEDVPPPPEV